MVDLPRNVLQDLGADQVYAWPTSEIAVMGPAGAANIIFKRDEDKDEKTAKYVEEFATPYKAAERGFVDVVIEPKHTRPAIINALAMLASKRETRAPKNTVISLYKLFPRGILHTLLLA